jgi:cytochrome c oxidase subunit IV
MTVAQEHEKGGIGKYLIVYIAILILAGLQFVIAYQQLDGAQMFARMLFVALLEAGLALMFFMHLWAENRGLLLFVAITTIFVLAAMQYGWPDSFRMLVGAPGAGSSH